MTLSQNYEVKSCKLIYLYKEILYVEIKIMFYIHLIERDEIR